MPRSRCRIGETEFPYFLTGTVVGWRGERLQTRKGTTRIITYTMTDRVEPVYNLDMGGSHWGWVGESGVFAHKLSTGPIPAPSGATNCRPDVKKATPVDFELVNPSKQSNFIIGELVSGGQLSFIVENLPKTTPPTGCPGRWMFQQMMVHFGASVSAIQGNWVGASSDNLICVNRLTAGGAMTMEQAAKQTWTGMRASDYGYTQVRVAGTPAGAPGRYTSVHVLFTK